MTVRNLPGCAEVYGQGHVTTCYAVRRSTLSSRPDETRRLHEVPIKAVSLDKGRQDHRGDCRDRDRNKILHQDCRWGGGGGAPGNEFCVGPGPNPSRYGNAHLLCLTRIVGACAGPASSTADFSVEVMRSPCFASFVAVSEEVTNWGVFGESYVRLILIQIPDATLQKCESVASSCGGVQA